MAMQFLRNSSKSGFLKYILLGFLLLAGGGLVLTDVGGFFRGGLGSADVGRVGSEKISIVNFDRNLRRTLSRLGLTPQQAYTAGYVDEILRGQMREIILRKAAAEQDILVGRQYIAGQVSKMIDPLVQDGQDPKDVLRQALMAQGISEGELVGSIAANTAGNLLTGAVYGGYASTMPGMKEDLALYNGENRTLELLIIPDSSVEIPENPDEQTLTNLYETYKERYALPETRELKILHLKNDELKKTIDISEETLKAAYEDNIAAYQTGEMRTLEQGLFSSADEAQKAIDKVKAGATLKTAANEVTGNETGYLGESEFEESGVLDEIKEPVFAAAKGDIVGPVQSALGWHVIIVKGIKEPSTKPFKDVSAALKEELLQTRLIDQMYALSGQLEDMLAGGVSLDEIKTELPVEIIDLPRMDGFGLDKKETDLLKDYAPYRDLVLQDGFSLMEGESSTVRETEDGNFAAVYVAAVTPKSYPELEAIKAQLIERWIAQQRHVTAQAKAEALLTLASDGGKTLVEIKAEDSGLKIQNIKNIVRDKEVPSPLTQASIAEIFTAPVDGYIAVPVEGGTGVAHIISAEFKPAKEENKEEKDAVLQDMRSEALALYLQDKERKYGTAVNRRQLEALYGPEAQGY